MEGLCRPLNHQPKEITIDTDIRVLKTGLCPSLSGKSKLTFEVGCDRAAEIHLRITKNSGSGWFSKSWVALTEVGALLKKNADKAITFSTLLPIFKGQSVNTAGFLLALLKHEGLVRPMTDNPRSYERGDAKAFCAEVKALMDPAPKSAKAKAKAGDPNGTSSDKAKAATPVKAKPAKPAVRKR